MSGLLADVIIVIILVAAVTFACVYIYREKKKGSHCIGCPMAGSCQKKQNI